MSGGLEPGVVAAEPHNSWNCERTGATVPRYTCGVWRWSVVSAIGLALVGAWQFGCGTSEFRCSDSGDCTVGTCEDTGYCSFPDEECMSGRRYGEHAGLLAEACVPLESETESSDSDNEQPTSITSVEPRGTETEDTGETQGDDDTTSTTGSTTSPMTSTTAVDPATTADASTSSTSSTDESSSTGTPGEQCFVDEFDGEALDSSWTEWSDEDVLVELTGEALQITNPAVTGGWGGVTSDLVFTNDSRAKVLIENPAAVMSGHEAVLELLGADGDRLLLMYSGGRARVIFDLMGAESTLAEQDVSASPDGLWLQIRVEDGELHFETSNDGTTFAAFFSLDPGQGIRSAMGVPNVYAGRSASTLFAGSVSFGTFEFCVD